MTNCGVSSLRSLRWVSWKREKRKKEKKFGQKKAVPEYKRRQKDRKKRKLSRNINAGRKIERKWEWQNERKLIRHFESPLCRFEAFGHTSIDCNKLQFILHPSTHSTVCLKRLNTHRYIVTNCNLLYTLQRTQLCFLFCACLNWRRREANPHVSLSLVELGFMKKEKRLFFPFLFLFSFFKTSCVSLSRYPVMLTCSRNVCPESIQWFGN